MKLAREKSNHVEWQDLCFISFPLPWIKTNKNDHDLHQNISIIYQPCLSVAQYINTAYVCFIECDLSS